MKNLFWLLIKTDLFDLKQKISLIKAKFFDFYTIDTTIFLTPVHDIKSLPESYSQLHCYIKTHLYFVKGKLLKQTNLPDY